MAEYIRVQPLCMSIYMYNPERIISLYITQNCSRFTIHVRSLFLYLTDLSYTLCYVQHSTHYTQYINIFHPSNTPTPVRICKMKTISQQRKPKKLLAFCENCPGSLKRHFNVRS